MAYDKRIDGRKFDEPRKMEAKVGVVKQADGSAMFRMGDTIAIAAVYGPRDLHPKFLQDPQRGVLRCRYNMMPFSGAGDRVRPGGNRRSKELAMVIEKALLPVLNLEDYPNAVVDLFIEFPQTDAGTRCAGICAASMALADAGLSMKDLVAAISVGKVDGTLLLDLNYKEEAFEGEVADIPIAMTPGNGLITLLQMDGRVTNEELKKAIGLAGNACEKIREIQRQALKEKFDVAGEEA